MKTSATLFNLLCPIEIEALPGEQRRNSHRA
jgi:hypothetical protein